MALPFPVQVSSDPGTDGEDSRGVKWGGAEGWQKGESPRKVPFFLNKGPWQQKETRWRVRAYHVGLTPCSVI